MRMLLPVLAALAFSPALQAGNVFKCKTADGSYVYQQAACPTDDKQVDRIGFVEEPAPAPTIRPSASAWDQQPSPPPQQPQSDYYLQDQQRQAPRETVAHICSDGGRTFTTLGECPSGSYEQSKLDRRELCRRLRDPVDDGSDGKSRRVYNRNKARSERC